MPPGPDPHRPIAHLTPRMGWLNDPHGLLRWRGQYHLFFQHNPHAATWGPPVWAHVTSPDLLHWQHQPHALTPDMPPEDDGGCWSGSVTLIDGRPCAFYTGVQQGVQTLCRADPTDHALVRWRKDPRNPLLTNPAGVHPTRGDLRDPWVWRMSDGTYRMLQGTSLDGHGNALVYASPDGNAWTYLHPLMTGEAATRVHPHAGMWEMPVLVPAGDAWLLMIGAWIDGTLAQAVTALGRFEDDRFTPERVAPLDHAHACVYAPHPLVGEDRTVWMAWMQDPRPETQRRAAGWAGALTLPRESWVEHGALRHRFAPEVDALHGPERIVTLTPTSAPKPVILEGAALRTRHACLRVTLARGTAERIQLTLHADEAGEGGSAIDVDFGAREVRLVYAQQDGDTRPHDVAPHAAMTDEVTLHAILDGGALELIIDERVTLTAWLPETSGAHAHVLAHADGDGARVTLRVAPLMRTIPEPP